MPIGRVKCQDPGLTPSEQRQKEQLLRQFIKSDGPKGNSEAYRDSPMWCTECERHICTPGKAVCARCDTAYGGYFDL